MASMQAPSTFQQLLTFDNGVQLMQASNQITQRGANDGALLETALNSAPTLQTAFPSSAGASTPTTPTIAAP